MKIYVVMDNDDVYGTFSTLEKAKEHVKKMVDDDLVDARDKMFIEYIVYSFVLDKSELSWSDDMKRTELHVQDAEVIYDNSKGE